VRNSSGLGFYRGIDLGFYRGIEMALAKVTIDHDEIRKWAEARDGRLRPLDAVQGRTGVRRAGDPVCGTADLPLPLRGPLPLPLEGRRGAGL
jgi:hypothetical protein